MCIREIELYPCDVRGVRDERTENYSCICTVYISRDTNGPVSRVFLLAVALAGTELLLIYNHVSGEASKCSFSLLRHSALRKHCVRRRSETMWVTMLVVSLDFCVPSVASVLERPAAARSAHQSIRPRYSALVGILVPVSCATQTTGVR